MTNSWMGRQAVVVASCLLGFSSAKLDICTMFLLLETIESFLMKLSDQTYGCCEVTVLPVQEVQFWRVKFWDFVAC